MSASQGGLTADDSILDALYENLRELESVDHAVRDQLYSAAMAHFHPDEANENRKLGLEAYTNHRKTLLTLNRVVDKLRGNVRNTINILSRPSMRPLSILDLPDEILVKIFEYAKGFDTSCNTDVYYSDHDTGTKTIKNVRLSCKRLCGASSHLLVHYIQLDFTIPASIARFKEISRHPTIRKGVRAVGVVMKFFDPELATDFDTFARYHAWKLEESAVKLERFCQMEREVEKESPDTSIERALYHDEVEKSAQMGKVIAEGWEDMRVWHADEIDVRGTASQRALKRAFEEYKKIFIKQRSRLKNSSFIKGIAAAMAKMPLATRLEFHDDHDMGDERSMDSHILRWIVSDESLIRGMLAPFSCSEARKIGLQLPPPIKFLSLLTELPVALRKAGVSLSALRIESSALEHFSDRVLSDRNSKEFTAAMNSLKSIGISPGCWSDDTNNLLFRESTAAKALRKFFTATLGSPRLEMISIDLGFEWQDHGTLPLSSVTTLRPWPRLQCLSLTSVPLTFEDLAKVVTSGKKSLCMNLHHLCLLDGTWADGLDLLRGVGLSCKISFLNPSGAECDTMTQEETDAIFKTDDHEWYTRSKAELYILGGSRTNPLREEEVDPDDMVLDG